MLVMLTVPSVKWQIHGFTLEPNPDGGVLEASFSPDAQFVIAGMLPLTFHVSCCGYSSLSSIVALTLTGLVIAKEIIFFVVLILQSRH